jgi:serine/threonine-protein kinase HipA
MRLPQEDFCQALGVASALKYESDGGPGIADSMTLLLGSQQANVDRERFFKSQILFWLLAGIDGHAKNFSVFIEPGTAYRMTPLYDIISAYPLMASKMLPKQKAKMAMALTGKNRHYHWMQIQPRHFMTMAKKVGFSSEKVQHMMAEMKQQTSSIINKVSAELPSDFPQPISDAIFEGLLRQAAILPN